MSRPTLFRQAAGIAAVISALHFANPAFAAPSLMGAPLPEADTSKPGQVPGFTGGPDDIGFNKHAASTLGNLKPSNSVTRGAKEASIFRDAAPSVVMVVTADGLGSGSLISATGDILTNAHVIRGAKKIGVVYKPKEEGREVKETDLVFATLVKVDPVTDLALIHAASVPEGTKALTFGQPSEIEVGADVHAIGHPTGETWTYTKGVVSQVRPGYDWEAKGEEGLKHHADVIQTQTPINPGNSGGPLLSDLGHIVGVNSFNTSNAQNLNFAVNVSEVQRFLAAPQKAIAPTRAPGGCDKAQIVFKGRSKDNTANIVRADSRCEGKPDFVYIEPDDKTQPILMAVDSRRNGRTDQVFVDKDRDGKWDFVDIDADGDGQPDFTGIIDDGSMHPSHYVKYRK